MFTAKQYRAKAAEYTELLKAASLPAEIREFRRLERSYLTLAENEEWMADNLEKINHPGADENWYGDAIIAQQGKDTLGCHGADVARRPGFQFNLLTGTHPGVRALAPKHVGRKETPCKCLQC